jgi:pimeloyl-ACP methyl ester carboxylesterase
LVVAYVLLARTGRLAPTEAEVRAAYGQPPAKFVTIDGVAMRYKDEGQGPVLVLLHAGNHSLEMWDAWVEKLRGRFRVIRPDLSHNGLTGADPTGRNDGGRAADLVAMLLDQLGVTDFALAGISSGSTVALRTAAKHPEQVRALILSTVPIAAPAGGDTPLGLRVADWVSDTLLGGYRPTPYWREQLKMTFGDDGKITDELIQRQWAFNGMPGRRAVSAAYAANNAASGFDYAAALARMTMPVLIQWGGASPVLPPVKANELAALFTASRSVETINYPGVGHYLYLESPDDSVRDAVAFLEPGDEPIASP